jgi:hypothetical protein
VAIFFVGSDKLREDFYELVAVTEPDEGLVFLSQKSPDRLDGFNRIGNFTGGKTRRCYWRSLRQGDAK